jgi:hypothetical protein
MSIKFGSFSSVFGEPESPALAALRNGLEVDFWPMGPFSSFFGGDPNKLAAARRAAVLFENADVADNVYREPKVGSDDLDNGQAKKRPEPGAQFQLKPAAFLQKARNLAPQEPQPTASGFAQWVYSLYASAYGDEEDRERGKKLEQEVFDCRLLAASCNDNAYLKAAGSSWRLIHNGLHVRSNREVTYYQVPSLIVRGKPIRVSPDLVYEHAASGEIFIVEIKNTWMNVPSNLWPNIWAQLWAYSKMPNAVKAPKVTVVGEVWGERWRRKERTVSLRASVKRDPRQPQFDRFFSELFEIYSKGSVSPQLPYPR